MNDCAKIMFEMIESDLQHRTKDIADHIQKIYSSESISPQQQRALEVAIRNQLDVLAWGFLGLFDNVGCRLPDGILGYRIRAIRSVIDGEAQEIDIRDGETDYADMWQEFQLHRQQNGKAQPIT
jgi:hypothetical protein